MSFLLYTNFYQLQFTIILLYLCLEGMHQIIHEKRNWLGAFLIGLGVIAKIGPIVLLPYLIYRGHFKGVSVDYFFDVFACSIAKYCFRSGSRQ